MFRPSNSTSDSKLEPKACRICGSKSIKRRSGVARPSFGENSRLREYEVCSSCRYISALETPSSDELAALHKNMPNRAKWVAAASKHHLSLERSWPMKLQLLEGLVSPRRVIDIGCATGEFLSLLPNGIDKHGIEVSDEAAEVARSKGIDVLTASVLDLQVSELGQFDLVLAFDVVEHIDDQQGLFRRLSDLLEPGGILAVETGNAASRAARMLGSTWSYISLEEHVCAHSRRSMKILANSVGLKEVEVWPMWHKRPRSFTDAATRYAKAYAYRTFWLTVEMLSAQTLISSIVRRPPPGAGLYDHMFSLFQKPTDLT